MRLCNCRALAGAGRVLQGRRRAVGHRGKREGGGADEEENGKHAPAEGQGADARRQTPSASRLDGAIVQMHFRFPGLTEEKPGGTNPLVTTRSRHTPLSPFSLQLADHNQRQKSVSSSTLSTFKCGPAAPGPDFRHSLETRHAQGRGKRPLGPLPCVGQRQARRRTPQRAPLSHWRTGVTTRVTFLPWSRRCLCLALKKKPRPKPGFEGLQGNSITGRCPSG